jgi:hypothetical protein
VIAAVPVGQVVGDGWNRLLQYVQRQAILPISETARPVIGHRSLLALAMNMVLMPWKSW